MGSGHHIAAWRHPDSPSIAGLDFQHFAQAAQAAEAAKFDLVFLSDSISVRSPDDPATHLAERSARLEPITLLSALAAVTERIGLVGTASAVYNEPFNVARRFASLDRLSSGRAGWNMVTSTNLFDPPNFGQPASLDHAQRYAHAAEFTDVVTGLWNSWDDGALRYDKQTGVLFDAEGLHPLHHRGDRFQVRGPLNVPPSPQTRPVLVQAGASDAGRETAARYAEVVFSAHQDFSEAQAFYRDVKSRLARYGRSPDELLVLPGVSPFVGRSEAEAQEKFEQLQSLITPEVGLALLRPLFGGVDLSAYPLDGPLPELPPTHQSKSRQHLLVELARREQLTIRQLYLRVAGARHWQLVGTPSRIADELEQYFRDGAADGYNIMAPVLPGGLNDFIESVVPELQRRGLFRTEYETSTLRGNLGMGTVRRPRRHSSTQAAVPSAVR